MAGTNQFPYPRKSSTTPAAYIPSRSSSTTLRQRRALKTYGVILAAFLALVWLFTYSFRSPSIVRPPTLARTEKPPPGTPRVVIVTPLEPDLSPAHHNTIQENRKHYASRHGYATFFPNTTDYDVMPNIPQSWSKVPALRHALTLYPHTQWIWYLSSTALIMNNAESLHTKLLNPSKLEKLMITDRSIIPPDSVIKTFSHLRGERVDFVVSQDQEGLADGSLMIRNGEWAKFFLDAWFDPLYRSYNFQKAERHALEHIVQWHGTVLAKLALVPQRLVNSYTRAVGRETGEGKRSCVSQVPLKTTTNNDCRHLPRR